MTTLSGILEWRTGTEGRIRQLDDRLLATAADVGSKTSDSHS